MPLTDASSIATFTLATAPAIVALLLNF